MDNKSHDEEPRELFEALVSWYDKVFEKFEVFSRQSVLGRKYDKALGDFLHESERARNNLKYALRHNELPEQGRPSRQWKDYNDTYTNLRLMELILELVEAVRKASNKRSGHV